MALPGKIHDVGNFPGLYLFNKEADIRPGHEGLSGALKNNGRHAGILLRFREPFGQLLHYRFIQCVHRLRAVDGNGGDVLIDGQVDKRKGKGSA